MLVKSIKKNKNSSKFSKFLSKKKKSRELDKIEANKICLIIEKILNNGILNISKMNENKKYIEIIKSIIDNHKFSDYFKSKFKIKDNEPPVNKNNVKKIIMFYCTNLNNNQIKTLKNYLKLLI